MRVVLKQRVAFLEKAVCEVKSGDMGGVLTMIVTRPVEIEAPIMVLLTMLCTVVPIVR